jgi:hypothetical protein
MRPILVHVFGGRLKTIDSRLWSACHARRSEEPEHGHAPPMFG